uniref:Uncharacterized protein TCIL3000_5_1750 n=1 Tax=Trypanosoma congolense (strain IL3000) TaxID=1068625 RepID=G0UMR4_TRYCI|nr:unnamed protein product [Trypanosoma congolense IL3000]
MAKKKPPCPSVNPQLYEKCQKPSITVAMGMKGSACSTSCWRAQVEKEESLRAAWAKKYDRQSEIQLINAVERTLQREKNVGDMYREGNDALKLMLSSKNDGGGGRLTAAYLKSRKARAPQDKYPRAQTEAQEVGWYLTEAEHAANSCFSRKLPYVNSRGLQMAYRRPGDEDHAALFGYSLSCSFPSGKV